MNRTYNTIVFDHANGVVLGTTNNPWAAQTVVNATTGVGTAIRSANVLAPFKHPQLISGQEPQEAPAEVVTDDVIARKTAMARQLAALEWVSLSVSAFQVRRAPIYAAPGIADALARASEDVLAEVADKIGVKAGGLRFRAKLAATQRDEVALQMHAEAEMTAIEIMAATTPEQVIAAKVGLAARLRSGAVSKFLKERRDGVREVVTRKRLARAEARSDVAPETLAAKREAAQLAAKAVKNRPAKPGRAGKAATAKAVAKSKQKPASNADQKAAPDGAVDGPPGTAKGKA